MSLPDYYLTATSPDITHRIANSIITYDDAPAYVAAAGAGVVVLALPLTLEKIKVPLSDPKLSVDNLGRRLGFFKLNRDGILVRPLRCVYKGMTQGLGGCNMALLQRQDNGVFVDLTGPLCNHHLPDIQGASLSTDIHITQDETKLLAPFCENNSVRWELPFLLLQKEFVNLWKYGYPDQPNADTVKEFIETAAPAAIHVISADVFLVKDAFGQAFVSYRTLNVGLIQQGRIRYLPTKAYLAGEIERQTGMMPI